MHYKVLNSLIYGPSQCTWTGDMLYRMSMICRQSGLHLHSTQAMVCMCIYIYMIPAHVPSRSPCMSYTDPHHSRVPVRVLDATIVSGDLTGLKSRFLSLHLTDMCFYEYCVYGWRPGKCPRWCSRMSWYAHFLGGVFWFLDTYIGHYAESRLLFNLF